jgi:hypothetical protein
VAAKKDKWAIHPVAKDARWKGVRKGLGALKEEGAHSYAFIEEAAGLLDLSAARAFAKSKPSGNGTLDDASSFVDLLREMVQPFAQEPHGRLLTILLTLDDPWTDPDGTQHKVSKMNLTERRALGGQWFRYPRPGRGVDAIRLNYEIRALNQLAVNLMRREVRETGHWIPALDPNPRNDIDRVLIYFSREIVPESGTYYACGPNGQRLNRLAECEAGERFPSLDVYTEFGWSLPINESGAEKTTPAATA